MNMDSPELVDEKFISQEFILDFVLGNTNQTQPINIVFGNLYGVDEFEEQALEYDDDVFGFGNYAEIPLIRKNKNNRKNVNDVYNSYNKDENIRGVKVQTNNITANENSNSNLKPQRSKNSHSSAIAAFCKFGLEEIKEEELVELYLEENNGLKKDMVTEHLNNGSTSYEEMFNIEDIDKDKKEEVKGKELVQVYLKHNDSTKKDTVTEHLNNAGTSYEKMFNKEEINTNLSKFKDHFSNIEEESEKQHKGSIARNGSSSLEFSAEGIENMYASDTSQQNEQLEGENSRKENTKHLYTEFLYNKNESFKSSILHSTPNDSIEDLNQVGSIQSSLLSSTPNNNIEDLKQIFKFDREYVKQMYEEEEWTEIRKPQEFNRKQRLTKNENNLIPLDKETNLSQKDFSQLNGLDDVNHNESNKAGFLFDKDRNYQNVKQLDVNHIRLGNKHNATVTEKNGTDSEKNGTDTENFGTDTKKEDVSYEYIDETDGLINLSDQFKKHNKFKKLEIEFISLGNIEKKTYTKRNRVSEMEVEISYEYNDETTGLLSETEYDGGDDESMISEHRLEVEHLMRQIKHKEATIDNLMESFEEETLQTNKYRDKSFEAEKNNKELQTVNQFLADEIRFFKENLLEKEKEIVCLKKVIESEREIKNKMKEVNNDLQKKSIVEKEESLQKIKVLETEIKQMNFKRRKNRSNKQNTHSNQELFSHTSINNEVNSTEDESQTKTHTFKPQNCDGHANELVIKLLVDDNAALLRDVKENKNYTNELRNEIKSLSSKYDQAMEDLALSNMELTEMKRNERDQCIVALPKDNSSYKNADEENLAAELATSLCNSTTRHLIAQSVAKTTTTQKIVISSINLSDDCVEQEHYEVIAPRVDIIGIPIKDNLGILQVDYIGIERNSDLGIPPIDKLTKDTLDGIPTPRIDILLQYEQEQNVELNKRISEVLDLYDGSYEQIKTLQKRCEKFYKENSLLKNYVKSFVVKLEDLKMSFYINLSEDLQQIYDRMYNVLEEIRCCQHCLKLENSIIKTIECVRGLLENCEINGVSVKTSRSESDKIYSSSLTENENINENFPNLSTSNKEFTTSISLMTDFPNISTSNKEFTTRISLLTDELNDSPKSNCSMSTFNAATTTDSITITPVDNDFDITQHSHKRNNKDLFNSSVSNENYNTEQGNSKNKYFNEELLSQTNNFIEDMETKYIYKKNYIENCAIIDKTDKFKPDFYYNISWYLYIIMTCYCLTIAIMNAPRYHVQFIVLLFLIIAYTMKQYLKEMELKNVYTNNKLNSTHKSLDGIIELSNHKTELQELYTIIEKQEEMIKTQQNTVDIVQKQLKHNRTKKSTNQKDIFIFKNTEELEKYMHTISQFKSKEWRIDFIPMVCHSFSVFVITFLAFIYIDQSEHLIIPMSFIAFCSALLFIYFKQKCNTIDNKNSFSFATLIPLVLFCVMAFSETHSTLEVIILKSVVCMLGVLLSKVTLQLWFSNQILQIEISMDIKKKQNEIDKMQNIINHLKIDNALLDVTNVTKNELCKIPLLRRENINTIGLFVSQLEQERKINTKMNEELKICRMDINKSISLIQQISKYVKGEETENIESIENTNVNFIEKDKFTKINLVNKDTNFIDKYTNTNINLIDKYTNTNINLINKHTNTNINLIDKHTNTITNLIDKHTNTNTNLIDKHTNTNSNLIDKHTNTITNLIDKHTNTNTNLINKHTNTNSNLIDKHTNSITNFIDKHTNNNTNLIDKHRNASKNLIDKHTNTNTNFIDKYTNTRVTFTNISIQTEEVIESNNKIGEKQIIREIKVLVEQLKESFNIEGTYYIDEETTSEDFVRYFQTVCCHFVEQITRLKDESNRNVQEKILFQYQVEQLNKKLKSIMDVKNSMETHAVSTHFKRHDVGSDKYEKTDVGTLKCIETINIGAQKCVETIDASTNKCVETTNVGTHKYVETTNTGSHKVPKRRGINTQKGVMKRDMGTQLCSETHNIKLYTSSDDEEEYNNNKRRENDEDRLDSMEEEKEKENEEEKEKYTSKINEILKNSVIIENACSIACQRLILYFKDITMNLEKRLKNEEAIRRRMVNEYEFELNMLEKVLLKKYGQVNESISKMEQCVKKNNLEEFKRIQVNLESVTHDNFKSNGLLIEKEQLKHLLAELRDVLSDHDIRDVKEFKIEEQTRELEEVNEIRILRMQKHINAMLTEFIRNKSNEPAMIDCMFSVTRSSVGYGQCDNINSNQDVPVSTADEPESWIMINYGKTEIFAHAYSVRHGWMTNESFVRNWIFEGSNDLKDWTVLKLHIDDKSLDGRYCEHTWELEGTLESYNSFRIRMTDVNSSGTHELFINRFIVYGVKDLSND